MFKDDNQLRHLILILTYTCQLKCKMCGQVSEVSEASNSNTQKNQLSFELIRQRLNELRGLRSVYLFGGEP